MKEGTYLLFMLLYCGFVVSAPTDNGFVVSSVEPTRNGKKESAVSFPLYPIIHEMSITSNISNRFAKTVVSSKVKNSQTSAKEATFTVVLPEKAFISEFVMEIGGKSYKAYVKEKEEAKRDYNRAVAAGQSAGHVAVSARDSNRFTVSVNIEAESKAAFLLTYEELLERKNDQYELVINIHPGQIVKHLNVEVHINESRPITFVKTPSLRSGNEISKNEDKLNPSSDIQIINSTAAVVKFNPDSARQKQFAKYLGRKESEGLSGQFIVQYDVERDPHGGEVLLQDGYFIHFFAPSDLKPLPKHVVFVLDTSGSMSGRKMFQLQDAMKSILDELKEGDRVNIVEFNFDAKVWDIDAQRSTVLKSLRGEYQDPFPSLSENDLPDPISVSNETITKAKNVIDRIYAYGGTNMIEGLEAALYLVKTGQENNAKQSDKKIQPIIIFLTDGEPNIGISSTEEIVKIITKVNSETNNVPIFSLSFGDFADKSFLKKLSLKNQGFSRHIYEASDASLQLQEFYKQISSPLLSDVKFKYDSEIEEVTKTHFPIFFRGSELIVAGKYKDSAFPTSVDCLGLEGRLILRPTVERPVTSLERLWAYLTVKQTLEKRDSVENKTELTKNALDLALKYSFVTDVTSLVVVKPDKTSAVDTEAATRDPTGSENTPYPQYQLAASNVHYAALPLPGSSSGSSSYVPLSARSFGPSSYGARFNSGFMPRSRIVGHRGYNLSKIVPFMAPTTLPASTPSTSVYGLETSLPWLTSVLNPNGTLTVAERTYELGDSSVPATNDQCPKTPVNSTENGVCALLKDCQEVHTALTDFPVYQQYFCSINDKYAGVCCPKKINPN